MSSEEIKKAVKIVINPLVYKSKQSIGKTIYKGTMNQSDIRGRVGQAAANYLKEKGWFK